MTHICDNKLTIISSGIGLSPDRRRQANIWTNVGILLIRTLRTNFSDIVRPIQTYPFKKMRSKMSSPKYRPFCLGISMLMCCSDNAKLAPVALHPGSKLQRNSESGKMNMVPGVILGIYAMSCSSVFTTIIIIVMVIIIIIIIINIIMIIIAVFCYYDLRCWCLCWS